MDRCRRRQGVSDLCALLPRDESGKPAYQPFKDDAPGCDHVDVKYLPQLPDADPRRYRFAALDGVTSAFELEVGTPDVDAWYRMMGPARLINFGVGAGHIGARMQVLSDRGFMLPTGPGRGPASAAQVTEIL